MEGWNEKQNIEAQISDPNLKNKLHLLGHQNNPWKFMAKADEYWQKSLFEGNSNALKEWAFLSSQESK